jgi:hypothetical protein
MAHTTKITTPKTAVTNEQEVVLKTAITNYRLQALAKKVKLTTTLIQLEIIQYGYMCELHLLGFETRAKYSKVWDAFHDKCKAEKWNQWSSSFPKLKDLGIIDHSA